MLSTLRSYVDHMVGTFYHIHIVLDYHHSMTCIHKLAECFQEHADIVEMQPCGGFIENKHAAGGILLGQIISKLHALALTT